MELRGHRDTVDQLCWHPSAAHTLATASADSTVRVWDSRTGKCTASVSTPGQNINIRYSASGNYALVGDKKDNISVLDTRQNQLLCTRTFPYEVNEVCFSPDERMLCFSTGKGTVEFVPVDAFLAQGDGDGDGSGDVDMADPSAGAAAGKGKANKADPSALARASIQAHTGHCYCLRFDPAGRYLATGGADAMVTLWDVDEMVCVRTFPRLESPIRTLSFSYNSQFIASASEDLKVDISDVDTGAACHSIPAAGEMNSVAWHPKLLLLAYAGDERDRSGRDAGVVSVFGYAPRS